MESGILGPWLQLMVTAQERIFRGAVTGRCNSETALLRRVFPSRGFQAGFHGIRHFLDWPVSKALFTAGFPEKSVLWRGCYSGYQNEVSKLVNTETKVF